MQPAHLARWSAALDDAAARVPDFERAEMLACLERLADVAPPEAAEAADPALLVAATEGSRFLRRFLVRHPDALDELTALPPVRDREAWIERLAPDVAAAADDPALMRVLRIHRHRAFLALSAREAITHDPLATGADLSAFASAALELTLRRWQQWLQPRFGLPRLSDGRVCPAVAMGMGKLGAGELNVSSDIDLIWVYASDDGETDGAAGLGRVVDLHTYFTRLFERVGRTLSTVTDEGFVFRVDLNLRPEGRSGPLCNSLDGLERYYEAFGHSWERLAWIKASPVAGDAELGERVLETLAPFVYRRHLDEAFLDEVSIMKQRIDARATRLGQGDGFDVKLGHGGIREIEFAVQALQLIWGGRLPELRARDTRTALTRLSLAGLLEAGEADRLLGAYRLLRRLEHSVQWLDDRQTHWLAGEPRAQALAAAATGHGVGAAAVQAFEARLADKRRRVREAFDAVLAGEAGTSADATDQAVAVALDPETTREGRAAALGELGFRAPEASIDRIAALTRRPESPFHPRQMARGGELARKLLAAVATTPDPDAALSHLESLVRVLRHRTGAFDQLAEDPRRLRTLMGLFGSSHYLSRLLVRFPGLLDRLVFDGSEPAVKSRRDLAAALAAEPGLAAPDADWEDLLNGVRRFHQAEVLRVGFFDLAGVIDTASVGRQLSDLADVIVVRVLEAATGQLVERLGPGAEGLGVVAMGKLAGRELGYGSDLDLIFLFDEARSDGPSMTRVAQRVITGLSCATPQGSLYDIDTRLRPSGNQGPLVVTWQRLVGYHAGEAQVWEKQAALRSRLVAGAPVLGETVETLRRQTLGSLGGERARAAAEIAGMRGRLEREVAAEDAHHYDLKAGLGGLNDVEFLVQFLQLTLTGPALEAARAGAAAGSPNTAVALGGLAEVGALDGEDARMAQEGYAWLRRLESRLRIVHDRPVGTLRRPSGEGGPGDDELRRLALRMGYGDAPGAGPVEDLFADYERYRTAIRALFEQVVGGP